MTFEKRLRDAAAVPTYRNTKFADRWEVLNVELAKMELPDARFGAARDALMSAKLRRLLPPNFRAMAA